MDERTIFLEALEQHDPADRAAFLDEHCGDDTELRQRVEGLLRAHTDAGSFLEKTPEEIDADSTLPTDDTWMSLLKPGDDPDRLGELAGYDVIELIGRGGMGIVLRAHDPKLNRIVAIKLLAPELAANVMAVRRFLREAQAAAAVSHDHVVTIHAIDEEATPPVIVMEYIDGQSLQQKIDKVGALDVKSVLRIGMQTAAGLAAAHRQGLVHRDIKPANILLENGIERVKLTDFGLARAVDDIGITRTGEITGTPQYMSPEQAQSRRVDHRTDLFSLGCVLYAMCTGRAAFRADSAVAVLHSIVHDQPRPVRELNEDIPDWLCAIVSKLIAKNVDDRFDSAEEVEELLGQHLRHLQQPDAVPQPAAINAPPETEVVEAPAAPWQAAFWKSPQPGFGRMVGYPILALLILFALVATAAQSAGVGAAEATIVSILAVGIFGLPIAFVVLILTWLLLRSRRATAASREPRSDRSFWFMLFFLIPFSAAGIARGQLLLSPIEAAIVAAVLGVVGATWINFARQRFSRRTDNEEQQSEFLAPTVTLDETVDLPAETIRGLRSVHWILTLTSMATILTPLLLYMAADQQLFPAVDGVMWGSLVIAVITFPIILGSALSLNWIEFTRRRPRQLVLTGTALAVIPWNPLYLLLLPWTIKAFRRVRQPDVLDAMGLPRSTSQNFALHETRHGLVRVGAVLLILATIAATTSESMGWTHWTVRGTAALQGKGIVTLTGLAPYVVVNDVPNTKFTAIGENAVAQHHISLAPGHYELTTVTQQNHVQRAPLSVKSGGWVAIPVSPQAVWTILRGPSHKLDEDGVIIFPGNATVSSDIGELHDYIPGRTVVVAPPGQYEAKVVNSSGGTGFYPADLERGGVRKIETPKDSRVSIRVSPDGPPASADPFIKEVTSFLLDPTTKSEHWQLTTPTSPGKPKTLRGMNDDGMPQVIWRLESVVEGTSNSLRHMVDSFADYIQEIGDETEAKLTPGSLQQGPNQETTAISLSFETDESTGEIRIQLHGFQDKDLHGHQFQSNRILFEIQESPKASEQNTRT